MLKVKGVRVTLSIRIFAEAAPRLLHTETQKASFSYTRVCPQPGVRHSLYTHGRACGLLLGLYSSLFSPSLTSYARHRRPDLSAKPRGFLPPDQAISSPAAPGSAKLGQLL